MILSTLDTKADKELLAKKSKSFLILTLFIIIFEMVYEALGHGVVSFFMIGAFLFPAVMGVLFYLMLSKINGTFYISGLFRILWGSSLYTFMLGFIYKGILDIYGTFSKYTLVYWVAGAFLLVVSLIEMLRSQKNKEL